MKNRKLLPSNQGVLVPRWLAGAVLFFLLYTFGAMLWKEPSWLVQRLDSPDQSKSAVLKRKVYTQPQFEIQVRVGRVWNTIFTSPPLEDDLTQDLRERLLWSRDSSRLYFSQQGQILWGWDFPRQSTLAVPELKKAQALEADRIAR